MIQHNLTSAPDSVEENPFNSNETPLVEVVTNSKDGRVKLFYIFLSFCLKDISKCMYSISTVLGQNMYQLRILSSRSLSFLDFSRAIDVMSYLQ